jgi:cytidyltransferase-like protein
MRNDPVLHEGTITGYIMSYNEMKTDKIGANDVPQIRRAYRGKKMVFCTGGFDLTHAGHALFFEDCKKLGDVLVVGIGPDKILTREKGKGRPILNEYIRLKMVQSLKPVDLAFIMKDMPRRGEQTLDVLYRIIKKLDPDIYVVNADASRLEERRAELKKLGIKLVVLDRVAPQRFGKISTTKIIEKIKNCG